MLLLRRRLMYEQAQKGKGFLAMLRDPVGEILENPGRYGSQPESERDLPDYSLLSDERETIKVLSFLLIFSDF